jgi:hypothetical protein
VNVEGVLAVELVDVVVVMLEDVVAEDIVVTGCEVDEEELVLVVRLELVVKELEVGVVSAEDVVWLEVVFVVPDRVKAKTPAARTITTTTITTARVATLLIPFLCRNLSGSLVIISWPRYRLWRGKNHLQDTETAAIS